MHPNIDSHTNISVGKPVKDVSKLAQYGERHSRYLGHADACQMIDRYGWSPFTDVLREITDPLKVICNSRDTQNFSQVDSDRLAFCDGFDNLLINRSLHFINRGIGRHQLASSFAVAGRQGLDSIANLTLDTSPHRRKQLRQDQ